MSHRDVFLYSPRSRYSIAPERRIYLDTSVIRRHLARLKNSPSAPFAYTSALTHIELLAGVTTGSERQYFARREAVRAIRDAGVQIDWRMPDAVILSSFPITRPEADIHETRTESLKALVNTLAASESRANFVEAAGGLDISEPLAYFETVKREFGHTFLEAGLKERRRSVGAFKPNEFTAQVLKLTPDHTHDDFVRAFQASPYNYIMSLWVYAERVMERKGIPFSKEARKEIALTKDGSIDVFLRALGVWQMDHALGRTPGKNDALDLAHLLYLVPDAILATADDGFAKCAVAVGVEVIGPSAWAPGA